jgi:hypothetical protein
MSKKKQTTTQSGTSTSTSSGTTTGHASGSTTNTFGQIHPEDTQDTINFRNWQPQMDPGIGYQAASAKRDLDRQRINPYGAYTTPAIREAQKRNDYMKINEQEGQQFRAGQYDVNQQKVGQLGSLAALTKPEIVQTGGSFTSDNSGTTSGTSSGANTGQGTAVSSGGLLGDILLAMAGGTGTAVGGAAA